MGSKMSAAHASRVREERIRASSREQGGRKGDRASQLAAIYDRSKKSVFSSNDQA